MNEKEKIFKDLYPFILNEDVTDIKWNGHSLWIEDLKKGRLKTNIHLSDQFLKVFTTRIAAIANVNFNVSYPYLQASIEDLRIHALFPSITSDGKYILAIRKAPAIARLNDDSFINDAFADALIQELLKALIRCHCSGIIIGDTGAGKTELQKYIASFLPENESCMTIEDALEMHLPKLYPNKDIFAIQINENYQMEQAIRDALRLLIRYLWIAEARGREIHRILEGASTGCCAWTTIHTGNVWEIPDRIVQMAGGENVENNVLENDFYTFFDVGIKVKKQINEKGIHRNISQICFFYRSQKKNHISLFMHNGKYTGNKIPESIMMKFIENNEWRLLKLLKGVKNEKTELL